MREPLPGSSRIGIIGGNPRRMDCAAMVPFFEQVYVPRHLAASASSTIEFYRRVLRSFRRYLGRPAHLSDLNDAAILGYCRWRLDAGVARGTICGEWQKLLALWRWAARHRFVEEWPDLRCPIKEVHRAPTAWTPAQMSALVAATSSMPGMVSGMVSPLWWRALALVGLDTGLRAKQLLRLLWQDVDLTAPAILASADWSKTGRDEHLGIAPDTAAALGSILLPTRRLVFPWQCHLVTFYHHWDRLLKLAGLPTGRRNKTQRLRRTCGTWAEIVGGQGAGQRILGHSTPSVTADHYLDRTQLPESNLPARFPRP